MSTLKVEVQLINDILPHPNADRLELAVIAGWQCVVQKGAFKPGDKCLYIPIDSVLPEDLEQRIFGPNSKIKLSKHRIKTIRLRGAISQGLAIPLSLAGIKATASPGQDFADKLGITKYEPPTAPVYQQPGKRKGATNPHFRKYTDIDNFKHYPRLFEEGEEVVITEKIHGTNFRCGWVPFVPRTLWQKIKVFFGKAPVWEFVYGSHNVQSEAGNKGGYYGNDVYGEIVEKYDLKKRLAWGEVIYGEIYGDGIQKNYSYECGSGERKLTVFDLAIVKLDGTMVYTDYETMIKIVVGDMHLPVVPLLHAGAFNAELAKILTTGPSVLAPSQKVKEGIVIKSAKEQRSYIGRKILKFLNDEYLLCDNTDWH